MAALVEALISQLIPMVLDKLAEQLKQVTGARKEIQKLKARFSSIQAALVAAEQRQVVDTRAKISLENLKDVAHELEDLLEEWLTKVLVNHLDDDGNAAGKRKNTKKKKMVCYYFLCPCSCLCKLPLYHNMGRRVKEIREQLDEFKETNQFLKEYDQDRTGPLFRMIVEEPRPMTSAVINPSRIVGRDSEINLVVKELVTRDRIISQPIKGIPVVSIVGMGGIGKTTLAQLVYHDPRVKTHFPTKIWVCVTKSFEKTRLAKAIIEAVDNQAPPDFLEWNPLHQRLGTTMKDKKFLLVLDDVWNCNSVSAEWEALKVSLDGGAEGSRVLLTTQDRRVAEVMTSSNPHGLERLSDEDSWSLLRGIALSGTSEEEIAKLEVYGKEIAKNCEGLPLAVKSLGNFMRNKITREDWEDVLKSETWKESVVRNNVVPALLFSYYALPSHLKRCFTYCAFLPRGYQIHKDVLIKLWMAQGFLVKTQRQMEELEKIGEDYFENLVMPSFFQDFTKDDDGNIITCKLHDLVHYLAQYLTENECLFMENTLNNADMISCKRALHSTLILSKDDRDQDSIPHFLYSAVKLRTLKLFKSRWNSLTLPKDLCERFSRLRVLDLSFTELDKLPQGIEKLIHLRYLDLSGARLEKLPDTVCKLYNLQTLMLNDCGELNKLPDKMGELRNLRHLEIKNTPKLFYLPVGIGRLNSLQTLSKFCVGSQSGGCKIEELKELDLLKGHLEINGLKRVKNENDAQEAKLENKQLHSLCLDFEHDILIKNDDEKIMECVLEALQPSPRLKKLEIRRYLGSSFSSWMEDSILSNIRILTLNDCKNCRKLPALGKLSSLEELRIENMDELELVGHEIYGIENSDDSSIEITFPRLKVLHIDGMLKLRRWYWKEQYGQSMPRLNHLFLQRCPKLKVLPENFPHRLSISVTDCPELRWGTITPAP